MAEAFYKAFVKYRKKYEPQWTVPTRETKPISIAPAVTKKPAIGAQPKKVQPVAVPVIPAPQKPKETTKEQAPDKQAAPAPQPQLPPEAQAAIKGVVPVFKVQVFAINRQLHHDSEQFKGHKEVDSFVEDGLYKYTIGASTNYNDIIKLKKKLAEDFPNCFIIAFDGDKRMNTSLAIAAFLQNAKKK